MTVLDEWRSTGRGGRVFAGWAIDAGLDPDEQQTSDALGLGLPGAQPRVKAAFRGVLQIGHAPFTIAELDHADPGASGGTVITVSARITAADGLPAALRAWIDPVYHELCTTIAEPEHAALAGTVAGSEVERALRHPALRNVVDGRDVEVPVVIWGAGRVVAQWHLPDRLPRALDALVAVLDAAVVRVVDVHDRGLACLNPRVGIPEPPRTEVWRARDIRRTVRRIECARFARRHGLVEEDPRRFREQFWPLGVAVTPALVLRGRLPGTAVHGRLVWGRERGAGGPTGLGRAVAIAPLAPRVATELVKRVGEQPGTAVVAGCLIVDDATLPALGAGLREFQPLTKRLSGLLGY